MSLARIWQSSGTLAADISWLHRVCHHVFLACVASFVSEYVATLVGNRLVYPVSKGGCHTPSSHPEQPVIVRPAQVPRELLQHLSRVMLRTAK